MKSLRTFLPLDGISPRWTNAIRPRLCNNEGFSLTIHGVSGEKWTSSRVFVPCTSSQECPRAIFTIDGAYPRAAERRTMHLARTNMRLVARDACGAILLAHFAKIICARPMCIMSCMPIPQERSIPGSSLPRRNFGRTPETEDDRARAYRAVWKYPRAWSLTLSRPRPPLLPLSPRENPPSVLLVYLLHGH